MKDMDKTKKQLIEEALHQEETLQRYAERLEMVNKIDRTILIAQSPEENPSLLLLWADKSSEAGTSD